MPPIRKSTLPDGAAWTVKPAPKRISVPACPNFLRATEADVPIFRSVGYPDVEGRLPPPELLDGFTEETNGSELPTVREVLGILGGHSLLPTDASVSPGVSENLESPPQQNL